MCVSHTGTGQCCSDDGCLTHADGVGGVQLAAVGALAIEGADHVATSSIDARVGLAFIDI